MYLNKHTTKKILDNKIFIGLHNCHRNHRCQIIQDLRQCLRFHRHHLPLKHHYLPQNPVIFFPVEKHFPRNALI